MSLKAINVTENVDLKNIYIYVYNTAILMFGAWRQFVQK